jgi:hypothetical protein
LRKSQKEQRKEEKRKSKEDKELERVLELSKRDIGRIESASHLLKLRSSFPPSPPAFTVLGNAEGKERHKVGRVSPLSEIPECNPDIEEKDPDPNHPSNRLLLGTLSPIDPINTLMENAFGLLFEPKSSDSRTDTGEKETDESNDSDDDDGVIVTLDGVPEVPEPKNQRLLDECEIQYHFNKTMAKYASNQMEAEHNASSDELQIDESKNASPSLTGMADPKRRSPSFSATELLLMHSSPELEDPSGSSDPEKSGASSSGSSDPEKSGASSSGTVSSTGSVVVTQNICDALSNEADSWQDEDDVLCAMASLSLSASKVTISRKTLAGMFFKARPPPCEMKQLLAAQEQSFEVA